MTQGLIGLVGGTTWLSTIDYYRYLNEAVARRRGGLHSARILLHSVDFGAVAACEAAGDLDGERRILIEAALSVQRGGATILAFCANTAHVHLPALRKAVSLPVISIVDALTHEIRQGKFERVAVLSTARTRNSGILEQPLARGAGCEILLPDADQQRSLDCIIREGAAAGRFNATHAHIVNTMVGDLVRRGAQAMVLACTELPQILAGSPVDLPLIDSTQAHVQAILRAS